jgi:general secretion pathway protein J
MRRFMRTYMRGFTLVELLVALVVMSLLALLSWRGLDGMTRVQSQTQGHTDSVLALQAGLSQWQTDLDAISLQANVPGVPGLEFDGQLLRLTRHYAEGSNNGQANGANGANGSNGASAASGTKTDSIRVVAWSQRTDDKGKQWLRWQSAPVQSRAELQAAWLQAAAWSKEGNEADRKREVTVAAIDTWQVFYYRNDAWSSALGSFDIGASAGLNPPTLPDGIRLVLTLAPGQALVGNITRDWARPTMGGGKG